MINYSKDPEYLKQKELIIQRLGKPEYDMRDPANESARELKKLKEAFQARSRIETVEKKKPLVSPEESKDLIKKYKVIPAVPIELSEADLEPFTPIERQILIEHFHNRNLEASELAKPTEGYGTRKVVALLRSGPYKVLASRVMDFVLPIEVDSAILKAVRDGDKQIILRAAELTGRFKPQESIININKPIQDEELVKKLKQLGDSI